MNDEYIRKGSDDVNVFEKEHSIIEIFKTLKQFKGEHQKKLGKRVESIVTFELTLIALNGLGSDSWNILTI